jgi:hypothetical protein
MAPKRDKPDKKLTPTLDGCWRTIRNLVERVDRLEAEFSELMAGLRPADAGGEPVGAGAYKTYTVVLLPVPQPADRPGTKRARKPKLYLAEASARDPEGEDDSRSFHWSRQEGDALNCSKGYATQMANLVGSPFEDYGPATVEEIDEHEDDDA